MKINGFNHKNIPTKKEELVLNPDGEKQKKKILVLANSGGGGHRSAAEALKKALEKEYQVEINFMYDQIDGSALFNALMKKNAFLLLSILVNSQRIAESLIVPKKIIPKLRSKMRDFKPDMIISVFPVGNQFTWELAKEAKIPMMVIVTDIYCKHFFNDIKQPGDNFKIGLPFNDKWIKKLLNEQFEEKNFVTTGFPLRSEFGLSKSKMEKTTSQICGELHIREGDKIVIVMMGSQGGVAITELSKQIADNPKRYAQTVHVVALCGSNDTIRRQTIEECKSPKNRNVKVHALGLKDAKYIAALMRRADVLISKPGGATVNEAIASELFTLYEGRGNEALFWERGNMEFVQHHGWGELMKPDTLVKQINKSLKRPKIKFGDCPGRKFDHNIRKIIKKVLDNAQKKDFSAGNILKQL